MSPQTAANLKTLMWGGLTSLFAALLAACLAWYVTASTNAEMTIQQQEMAAVNQFDESGANLDSSMSDFIDGLADGRVDPAVRKALRTALALHAAKSQRLANIVGSRPVEDYTIGLGRLREMVDAAEDVPTGMTAAQLHADILANKKRISEVAWKRIAAK